ncbi:MAG: glutamate-1-semialdehyde 2,1-aminomutase [Deltaproteobacteria bacterium]|nr:glutamate-1-semialdehyde 2,1-aminomutase [Deltaproteobacteria bacterium]
MANKQSEKLFAAAKKIFPGGVNSPVRAFQNVGGHPRFIARAAGAYLSDVDGNNYIDYVGSWGPMIAGHAHPKVVEAVQATSALGCSFGAPSPLEVQMATQLMRHIPSLQRLRMVNSGTEAVMGALRAARGFTGKNKILKFAGCYHGHADYLLVKAGSGALTHGRPDSLGVPESFVEHTLVAPYNDLEAARRLAMQHRKDLAAIIVEPIVGNMGCVLPKPGFLKGLRELCDKTGALLVFDEVMTGFRVHLGGAQGLYQIRPDLTTLGKVIGGGLPVGAYGGRADVMKCVSPEGGVYQAGTLSGNPVAMAAGLATLKLISTPKAHAKLLHKTERLALGIREVAERAKLQVQVPYTCGMLSLFFNRKPVENLDQAMASDAELFRGFFWEMLRRGIYLPPSPYEAWFVSLAHGENEIAKTLRAAKDSFLNIAKENG